MTVSVYVLPVALLAHGWLAACCLLLCLRPVGVYVLPVALLAQKTLWTDENAMKIRLVPT